MKEKEKNNGLFHMLTHVIQIGVMLLFICLEHLMNDFPSNLVSS